MYKPCNVLPYIGNEPFAFVCYSRIDQSEALTLIERLAYEGFRIWYLQTTSLDDEKQNLINKRLEDCEVVVALYSQDAASDHQFRKVVTAAVLNGKRIVPVFLEDFELSCGMKLQLDHAKRIDWYDLTSDLTELKNSALLKRTKGDPNLKIRIEKREGRTKSARLAPNKECIWPVSMIIENEDEILQQKGVYSEDHHADDIDGHPPFSVPEVSNVSGCDKPESSPDPMNGSGFKDLDAALTPEKSSSEDVSLSGEQRKTVLGDGNENIVRDEKRVSAYKTVIEDDDAVGEASSKIKIGRRGTLIIDEIDPLCIRLSTGERFLGHYGRTTVGRETGCDICIPDATVSALHLQLTSFADDDNVYQNSIMDCDSSNGTWLDCERLESGTAVSVKDGAVVSLGRRVQLFVAFADVAQLFMFRNTLAVLERQGLSMPSWQAIYQDDVTLGRAEPWDRSFFADDKISRVHARLNREGDGYLITDESANGTYINGAKIPKHIAVALQNGDRITMGRCQYVFHLIKLKEN